MKQKFLAILAVFVAAAALTACGASGSRSEQIASSSAASTASYNTATGGGYAAERSVMDEVDMDDAAIEAEMGGGTSEAPSAQANIGNRMIITTVDIQMQTTKFDQGVAQLQTIVEDFGGFIQDSYVEGQSMFEKYGTRSANFTARIPSDRLDSFMSGVGGLFNIISKNQSGQDITDAYYDTEARLNSLKIQEERLLEMMESATELQYLIEVQRELSNVQYQIDSFTSSKMRMENQVAMSTVHLYLNEVIEYTPVEPEAVTFGERLSRTMSSSLESFVAFVQDVTLGLVWMLPFLLTLAFFAAIIVFIILMATRKSRKAKRAWRESQAEARAAHTLTPKPDTAPKTEPAEEEGGKPE